MIDLTVPQFPGLLREPCAVGQFGESAVQLWETARWHSSLSVPWRGPTQSNWRFHLRASLPASKLEVYLLSRKLPVCLPWFLEQCLAAAFGQLKMHLLQTNSLDLVQGSFYQSNKDSRVCASISSTSGLIGRMALHPWVCKPQFSEITIFNKLTRLMNKLESLLTTGTRREKCAANVLANVFAKKHGS